MRKLIISAAALGGLAVATPSYAGGVLGDFVGVFCPSCGKDIDDWHRNVKEHNPDYKRFEEGVAAAGRRIGSQIIQDRLDRFMVR